MNKMKPQRPICYSADRKRIINTQPSHKADVLVIGGSYTQ